MVGFIMAVSLGTKALSQSTGRTFGMVALGICTLQALYFITDMAALW